MGPKKRQNWPDVTITRPTIHIKLSFVSSFFLLVFLFVFGQICYFCLRHIKPFFLSGAVGGVIKLNGSDWISD